MKLRLRRAVKEDWGTISTIREACIWSLAPDYYTPREVESWLAKENAMGTRERLESGHLWAGMHDDRVVGYSCGAPGEVEGLFVHPAFQGFGLGKLLLIKAEEPSYALRKSSIKVISTRNAEFFYRTRGYRVMREVAFHFPSGLEIGACELRKELRS